MNPILQQLQRDFKDAPHLVTKTVVSFANAVFHQLTITWQHQANLRLDYEALKARVKALEDTPKP